MSGTSSPNATGLSLRLRKTIFRQFYKHAEFVSKKMTNAKHGTVRYAEKLHLGAIRLGVTNA